jgi:hypothetical protein
MLRCGYLRLIFKNEDQLRFELINGEYLSLSNIGFEMFERFGELKVTQIKIDNIQRLTIKVDA